MNVVINRIIIRNFFFFEKYYYPLRSVFNNNIFLSAIFTQLPYLKRRGAPISLPRHRFRPFDVDSYYLMGCCLAVAATSALE